MDRDEMMRAIEEAAATADKGGELFVRQQQLQSFAVWIADVLDTHLSQHGYGRMNPHMKAVYAELTRLFLERELIGE